MNEREIPKTFLKNLEKEKGEFKYSEEKMKKLEKARENRKSQKWQLNRKHETPHTNSLFQNSNFLRSTFADDKNRKRFAFPKVTGSLKMKITDANGASDNL